MAEATISDFQMGHGLAWSYFYGYLKLVLPGLEQRVKESEFCTAKDKNKIPFLPKMIIILPESCFCPGSLTDDDPNITHHGYINFSATRAGNVKRDYKSSVYLVKNPDTNEEFYAIVEYATPLLSMFEMENGGVSGLTAESKAKHRLMFSDQITQILHHPKHQELHNSFCFLHLNDNRDEDMKPRGWRLSKLLAEKVQAEIS